ncbi:hypothetical protein AOQ71_29275 [Bradyrhizobium manausense]|uniref:Uncharacterized protein n=1 Tax=Bradyrhizobium manausense TaxID=989370 RepID=A0A0R3DCB9_9BRAD|nr:hypothetical protein AOQ71_29275 [Bradyrhizobium manausense]
MYGISGSPRILKTTKHEHPRGLRAYIAVSRSIEGAAATTRRKHASGLKTRIYRWSKYEVCAASKRKIAFAIDQRAASQVGRHQGGGARRVDSEAWPL